MFPAVKPSQSGNARAGQDNKRHQISGRARKSGGYRLTRRGNVQFIVATHSPIFLTFPGATIVSFDDGQLKQVALGETAHFQITRGILEAPQRYWRELLRDDGPE